MPDLLASTQPESWQAPGTPGGTVATCIGGQRRLS